ncbi:MAG: NAD-glutamate dehydrogenase [Rickettsiaceae bacterium]|nr:NAD-glutamate dehydrogenase [Rickettsiaceae bacterium]
MGKRLKKNNENEFVPNRLECTIDEFDAEILQSLSSVNNKGELYTKFIRRFLNYIPVDYRLAAKTKIFGDFAEEAYEFFKHLPASQQKIEITKTRFNNEDALNILLLEKNIPFVIDSLNTLITQLGLETICLFHPVISCVRDEKGNLQDILGKYEEKNSESLIYIKVLGSFNDLTIQDIKNKIIDIMNLVSTALDSWQLILDKVDDLSNNIARDLPSKIEKPNQQDALDFITWIKKNNITFLGVVEFDAKKEIIIDETGVKAIWHDNIEEIELLIRFSKGHDYINHGVMLGKLNKVSPIHRNVLVDYILFKQFDEKGDYHKGTIIFGLYGTAIYYQSIQTIPILNKKMHYVLETCNFPPNGYNVKKIKNIIESLPRDILIQVDERDLYCMCMHMLSAILSHKLKLFVQQDWSKSFIDLVIFMPREKLTPEIHHNINNYLSEKFNCEIISDNVTVVSQDFIHLFVTISIQDQNDLNFSHEAMQNDLVKITTNWSDALTEKLCSVYGEYVGKRKYREIESSFSNEYRYKFTADNVIEDLSYIQEASDQQKLVYNFLAAGEEFKLKIYSPEKSLILSDILPPIENLGFVAIEEQSFFIRATAKFCNIWLYEFKLTSIEPLKTDFAILKSNIEEALDKITHHELPSDNLCKLITLAGFDWVQVKVIKSLTSYLAQTGFMYSKDYAQQVLVKHYKYTEMLFQLFESMFSPKIHSISKSETLVQEMINYLDHVDISAEDKVLSNMRLIIQAMLRTNVYQKDPVTCGYKKYFSFKFRSEKVPDLPLPIPYAEIFVYANDFEAIHLRGGKVGRGGIRWSDREEDYRREVLALLKAQMPKNTIIVPTGSKGTFVVKLDQNNYTREEYMQKVVNCYQDFLRGLLDITDNLIDNKVVKPKDTITYDDANPYLVVAADKGTGAFSDYANTVSKEYNFWLSDAFASGGSVGYDHKKMGITSKGVWITAKEHLRTLGIDATKQPFTVMGIGDMSGDVFGNGLLSSEYMKLVGAFNHQHIFIDPNPDLKASFLERKRLFSLPRSSWNDYDTNVLSEGGRIYSRSTKILELTPAIQKLIGTNEIRMTPEQLIRNLLKLKVDLIWNGGIGTYIKSTSENNIDIGDKNNDNLRINGSEVNAKVIAEGGNVGVSQLGRVEYALAGGAINTDFIDNSAGVDCSDHEVNIKIALNLALEKGKITLEERNKLLANMTEQVKDLVLQDNHDQHLAITIASLSSVFDTASFSQLIRDLEQNKLLDSKVEFLPTKAELARRSAINQGFTRPELAVLLSYSKMALEFDLLDSQITQDKYFDAYLIKYFPKMMQEDFRDEILQHPLRHEIIKTIIVNKMVNSLGGTNINYIKVNTGVSIDEIVKAYEIVIKIFNLGEIWKELETLLEVSLSIRIEMFTDLIRSIRRGINWFLRHSKLPINIQAVIDQYQEHVMKLSKNIDNILLGASKAKFASRIEYYHNAGVKQELAILVAMSEILISVFDVIFLAEKTSSDMTNTAQLYFAAGEKLDLDWLRYSCETQRNDSYWNRLSIQSLKDDFYDKQKRLVCIINKKSKQLDIESWLKENDIYMSIFVKFIEEIKTQDVIDLNMIILANKKLEVAIRKIEENR